ncbi:MAG: hypothetical protein ACJ757_10625 [Gaiellaceae bacterium]
MPDDALRQLLNAIGEEGIATRSDLRERLGTFNESVLQEAIRRGLVYSQPGMAETNAPSRFTEPDEDYLLTPEGANLIGRQID